LVVIPCNAALRGFSDQGEKRKDGKWSNDPHDVQIEIELEKYMVETTRQGVLKRFVLLWIISSLSGDADN
jgi:hypothetical protein